MATHEWYFTIMTPLRRSERHSRRTDGRRALRSIAGTYPAQRGAGKGAVGNHRHANNTQHRTSGTVNPPTPSSASVRKTFSSSEAKMSGALPGRARPPKAVPSRSMPSPKYTLRAPTPSNAPDLVKYMVWAPLGAPDPVKYDGSGAPKRPGPGKLRRSCAPQTPWTLQSK